MLAAMTDATPPAGGQKPGAASGAAPGWYPTAPGSPTLRWWDGMQWTDHLRNQQDLEPPAVSTVTSQTPVYTVFIWLYTLLPLVSVLALIPVDLTGMVEAQVRQSLANPRVGSTGVLFASSGYVLLQALSVVTYAAMWCSRTSTGGGWAGWASLGASTGRGRSSRRST
jgi:hypothetical protein